MMRRNDPEAKALRAIRRFCLDCQGGCVSFVSECADTACPLYPWRLPDASLPSPRQDRALRGARRYCFVCAGGRAEIRLCSAGEGCALWPYRFGVEPGTYRRVMARVRGPRELWLPGISR